MHGRSNANGYRNVIYNKTTMAPLETKDLRVMFFNKQYPCSTMTIGDQSIILNRLHKEVICPLSKTKRRETLRITLPFIDIMNCQMGSLQNGTLLVLKLHATSYSKFIETFQLSPANNECSPDNFLRIITKQTIPLSKIRTFEASMKHSNVNVHILYGASQFSKEQLLKNCVAIEDVLTAVPEAIHIDDDINDEQTEDFCLKELLKHHGKRVSVKDYMTLLPRNYLNDSIIDYYLNHIQENFDEKFPELRMAIIPAYHAEIVIRKSWKKEHSNSAISRLVSNKQLSNCDFIVLPLVRDQHWFMAVITNVKKSFQNDYSSQESVNLIPPNELPVVIYFDSFDNYFRTEDRLDFNNMIYAFLHDCLIVHKQTRNFSHKTIDSLSDQIKYFKADIIKFVNPVLPQQTNNHDCGLFLLEYAERFFQDPINIVKTIEKNENAFEKWFLSSGRNITRKYLIEQIRENISDDDLKKLDDFIKNKKNF